jgi:hypothetical protein
MRPLSAIWKHSPQFIETTFAILRAVEETTLRWNRRLIRNRAHVSKRLFLQPGEEVA